MSTIATESNGDVAFSRSLLIHSSNASSVRSWLSKSLGSNPGPTSAEEQDDKIDVEADEEGGLGFVRPVDASSNDRQSHSVNDKLRKQFLGANAARKHHLGASRHDGFSISKARPQNTKVAMSESSDEAEGRTTATSKKTRVDSRKALRPVTEIASNLANDDQESPSPSTKKRSSGYLDEVLAQRHKKKKKTNNPKKSAIAKIGDV